MAGTQAYRCQLLTNPSFEIPGTDMFILLTETTVPRVEYAARFLLQDLLGSALSITDDRSEWLESDCCRINYTRTYIPDAFWIPPSGLLHEQGIRSTLPDIVYIDGLPVLYPSEGGDFPFDIFSAAFFLISRYEEYLPYRKDDYGRFDHQHSLAWTGGFLDRPLVDIWAMHLGKALQRSYPAMMLPVRSFRWVPTYDIDLAWAYRHRGLARTVAGMAMSLMQGRLIDLRERFATLLGWRPDPFEAYDWLDGVHDSLPLQPIYFFLVAGTWGRYDRNIPPGHPNMRALVSRHARRYAVGMHPSWQSGDKPMLMEQERDWLMEMADTACVLHSRQHYLRFGLPETYRELIRIGITDDYSMGYGGVNGFRASTCTPFPWYDLLSEQATQLKVHPFCFMDATAHHELRMAPTEALASLLLYLKEVRHVGGDMITIFHNNMLGTHRMYHGWRRVYTDFINAYKAE